MKKDVVEKMMKQNTKSLDNKFIKVFNYQDNPKNIVKICADNELTLSHLCIKNNDLYIGIGNTKERIAYIAYHNDYLVYLETLLDKISYAIKEKKETKEIT